MRRVGRVVHHASIIKYIQLPTRIWTQASPFPIRTREFVRPHLLSDRLKSGAIVSYALRFHSLQCELSVVLMLPAVS